MEAINENLEDLFNAMPWINIQKEIKPQIQDLGQWTHPPKVKRYFN